MNVNGALSAYQTQTELSKSRSIESNEVADNKSIKSGYGKTVGEPQLSEKAEKYYNQLKKKFGQYDFILVSSEEKDNARANAGQYANSLKTVVLIDEEKIERMATDEKFRKQYEGILSGATQQIEQIKEAAQSTGANLKGVVMQVNDDGTTSYFAALQKTNDAQKERLEKKAEQKKEQKKAEQKKADRIKQEEQLKDIDKRNQSVDTKNDEIVTIMADDFESLIKKIEEYKFNELSNSVQTESEKMIGQNIDFRG